MRLTNNPNEDPNKTNVVVAIAIVAIIVYLIFKTDIGTNILWWLLK
jgi:ABC-type uncharacterized transport system permease subunit